MASVRVGRLIGKPDISSTTLRLQLPRRPHPYWHPLTSGRCVGYYRPPKKPARWIARFRDKCGDYHQCQIGAPDDTSSADGVDVLSFQQALERAKQWFTSPAVASQSNDPKALGRMSGLMYSPVGNAYTLAHALQEYLEWKRLASAETHYNIIVSLINHHILPRFGPFTIDELRSEHFRKYFLEILETLPGRGNRSAGVRRPLEEWDDEALRKRKKTINALISILRDTLQRAWEDGRTDNDRLWRSLRTIPNVDRPRILHLSRTECRKLLKHCRPDLRQLVLGTLYTGCRSLEILRLRVSDVGRDGRGVFVSASKSRKSRFVFLPDEGMAFFLELIKGKPPHAFVFTCQDGNPWGERHRYLLQRSAKRAGLPKEFCFHCLRHTYASQLVQSGAPLTAIAEQLGHINTVTVSRTYGHVAPQVRESEVRQRFTSLTKPSKAAVLRQKRILRRWTSKMEAMPSTTYATINDLRARSNTLD